MTVVIKNLLIILLLTSLCAGTNAKPARSIVGRLIHRDSIHSPHYKQNDTIYSRAKRAIESSHARYAYIAAKAKAMTKIDSIYERVGPDPGTLTFMVNVSMGTPLVSTLMNFDTTTSLSWVQCLPCGGERCDKQRGEIFDPTKSSTYKSLSCLTSPECASAPHHSCDKANNDCLYEQQHYSGASSVGTLSKDTFKFDGIEGEDIFLYNVTFGCGHLNNDHNPVTSGLLGLGGDKFSMVSQSSTSQFSYCLGGIINPDEYGALLIGNDALYSFTESSTSTTLAIKNGLYYLRNANHISLGEQELDIDPNILGMSDSGDSGVVIDSGTSFSYLPRQAIDAISGALQTMFENKFEKVTVPENPNYLCYKADVINGDFAGYTQLAFNDIDMGFEMSDVFFPYKEGISCMGFLEAPTKLSILGALVQRHCNVGFNLATSEVYFRSGECNIA